MPRTDTANGEENGKLSIDDCVENPVFIPIAAKPSDAVLMPMLPHLSVVKFPTSVLDVGDENGNLLIFVMDMRVTGFEYPVEPPVAYPSIVLLWPDESAVAVLKEPILVAVANGNENGKRSITFENVVGPSGPLLCPPTKYPKLNITVEGLTVGVIVSVGVNVGVTVNVGVIVTTCVGV